ncbi:ATP-binding cassette domain-containing protein [Sporolactobacillus terrae]|uniref:ABC transporter ATP-binding protein n=1 Tax=Sporolactobacillus terrae TaxID=269673 RepID=A0A410DB65_9BACL|nr:ATP-binding cassette domain-containing protein [Sporolactobacillus terrae]QAA23326.1 methionine ABC transporter ATP-binding protein [Sporolactobacillus terrae]QAA26298.1 methionine ABC transporter ATP-binding protein [Sporolactobacillus terrae]BBN99737.1 ABC transporter ATP-binding protein [Sporolactobacillus terrae]
MSLLEFSHVSFTRENRTIVNDLSLSIEAGDFLSIVGPSGSGKSTVLRLCCHLISPTEGTIHFHGQDLMRFNPMELRKQISYCFQMPYLFGDTVRNNLEYPFLLRNKPVDPDRLEELFAAFQMSTSNLEKEIQHLSGGEKQRIALMRSIVFQPEILLLDEVTSALDVANTQIVEKVIEALNQAGITILWITHNPEQSRKYANKILTIDTGEVRSLEAIR